MFKNSRQLSRLLDYTLLSPTVSQKEIQEAALSAIHYQFAGLCVPPTYVEEAKNFLAKTDVKVSTVIGFPLGHSSIAVKIVEAMEAVKRGAQELEIMINLGPLKAGDEAYTLNEIRNIINVSPKSLHKIIIEIGLLNQKEKKKACQIILKTGAAFVKTSTGFGPSGATVEDIRLLARETGKKAKVKASGGIRTLQRVVELWKAGASRIGTSAAVSIMKEYEDQFRFQNHHSKAS